MDTWEEKVAVRLKGGSLHNWESGEDEDEEEEEEEVSGRSKAKRVKP